MPVGNKVNHRLKPCLVIGTGFHRWVLGDSLASRFAPLLDWNALLLQVAGRLGLALDRTSHSLSLHWEHMLATALEDGFTTTHRVIDGTRRTVARVELQAKMEAAAVLAGLKDEYPVHSRRSQMPLNEEAWGAVVSLNFDAHWLPGEHGRWSHCRVSEGVTAPVVAQRGVLDMEMKRLNHFVEVGQSGAAKRLWFPNGYIEQPSSLRLGLREFGFQPVAIQHAFAHLKAFERKAGPYQHRQEFVCATLAGASIDTQLANGIAPLPLTWVTEMMYRPVFFAGVGLSDAEQGLWWLMVQRARNLANVPASIRPGAFILLHHQDSRMDFWRTRPCGIEPLVCTSWEQGWQMLLERARA